MSISKKNKYTTAIILAAGIGSRFASSVPKQRVSLLGKSIIRRAVEPFYRCDDVDSIVVVTRGEDVDFVNQELRFMDKKNYDVVVGGGCRAESAKLGFCAIPSQTTHVAIHDGARCLITKEAISLVIREAHASGAASAVSPMISTVKRISNDRIMETVKRDDLVLAETPQVFECNLYSRALSSASDLDYITDDNMLLENIGINVTAVVLDTENPKITYSRDLEYAEFLLKRREEKCLDSE